MIPVQSLMSSTDRASGPPDLAGHAVTVWWNAVEQSTRYWTGPANPWLAGLEIANAALAASRPRAPDQSWYRRPGSFEAEASVAFAFAPWSTGTWAAMWGPGATALLADGRQWPAGSPMTVLPPYLQEWYAAWMEGATRAMLPAPMASAVEAMRHPDAGIPFVSYRSDGGHAVAQIGYATAKACAATAPFFALMPSPSRYWS